LTVIVGIKDQGKIYMGCDSAISTDAEIWTLNSPKIIKKGELLIGITGSIRGIQLLEHNWCFPEDEESKKLISSYTDEEYIYRFVVPCIKEVFACNQYCIICDGQESMEDWFLIGYRGELYSLVSHYQCFKIDKPYVAIGSGGNFALGSLKTQEDLGLLGKDPEMNITRAIKCACEFSNSVREPIRIFEV